MPVTGLARYRPVDRRSEGSLLQVALWQDLCLGLPPGLGALSNFTLAIINIATVDLSTITWKSPIATVDIRTPIAIGCTPASPKTSPACPPAASDCQSCNDCPGGAVAESSDCELLPGMDGCPESVMGVLPVPPTPELAGCDPPVCPCRGATTRCFVPPASPVPSLGDPQGVSTTTTQKVMICQDEKTGTIFVPSAALSDWEMPKIFFYKPYKAQVAEDTATELRTMGLAAMAVPSLENVKKHEAANRRMPKRFETCSKASLAADDPVDRARTAAKRITIARMADVGIDRIVAGQWGSALAPMTAGGGQLPIGTPDRSVCGVLGTGVWASGVFPSSSALSISQS